MKAPTFHGGIRGLAAVLAAIASGQTAAYYLTAFLFGLIHWRPHPLVIQIVNTVLGLALMVLTALIAGTFFFRSRAQKPFSNIIDALERIARGDFSTRVDHGRQTGGPVGELVQSVNNMALQLDQMEKMRQEFISNVSHEIQSPLTSIRGFASALRQGDVGDESRSHYLDIIEAESTRLSLLSANLLKLASLETDQVRFQPAPFRLDTQIRSLILACEPQWSGKHLGMDVSLEEAGITGDEQLLSQVWSNLIFNSIKFTPEGGKVRVALHKRADQVEVSIADTGIGIAPEDQPHVFERFYKADKSRNRSAGGSGLGLAIAKKVVQLHRGTIAVQSQPGAGATFIVELPRKVAAGD
ncbi:Two-component sensor histidine kinase [Candidatus Sulfopaludibacter sp. SbA3]|nr:Two-component sensor histidine kinase [Candidatus Sulfopaludibacter sp. SbA3]